MAIIKTWIVEHEGKTYQNSAELLSDEACEMARMLGIDIDEFKLKHLSDVQTAIKDVLGELGIAEKCRRCNGEGRVTLYTREIGNTCLGCLGTGKKVHINKRTVKKLQKAIDSMEDYEALNALVAKKLKHITYYEHKGIKRDGK